MSYKSLVASVILQAVEDSTNEKLMSSTYHYNHLLNDIKSPEFTDYCLYMHLNTKIIINTIKTNALTSRCGLRRNEQ